MALIYRSPSGTGYPTSLTSVQMSLNVQDMSQALNDTTEAELLLFNGIEGKTTAVLVDAFLGVSSPLCSVCVVFCARAWDV